MRDEIVYHTGNLAKDRHALPHDPFREDAMKINSRAEFYYSLYRRGLGHLFQRQISLANVDPKIFDYLFVPKDAQQFKRMNKCSGF